MADLPDTVPALQEALIRERSRSHALAEELQRFRAEHVRSLAALEQEEEAVANKLLLKLEQLQREKQELAQRVEEEEEMISNTLQKKLSQVLAEKAALEARLAAEEIRELTHARDLVNAALTERTKLTEQVTELQRELELAEKRNLELRKSVIVASNERFSLEQKERRARTELDRATRDRVALERVAEAEDEHEFIERAKALPEQQRRARADSLDSGLCSSDSMSSSGRNSSSGSEVDGAATSPGSSPAQSPLHLPLRSPHQTSPLMNRFKGAHEHHHHHHHHHHQSPPVSTLSLPVPRLGAVPALSASPRSPRSGAHGAGSQSLSLPLSVLSPRGGAGGLSGQPLASPRSVLLSPHPSVRAPTGKMILAGWISCREGSREADLQRRHFAVYDDATMFSWDEAAAFSSDDTPIDAPLDCVDLDTVISISPFKDARTHEPALEIVSQLVGQCARRCLLFESAAQQREWEDLLTDMSAVAVKK